MFSGHTVIRVDGYAGAEKYPMPRDCEAIMLDSDPDSNYLYMKKTDSNGGYRIARYKYIEEPIPKFDPDKYLSVDEFKKYQEENRKFQEDILDAINSIRQPTGTGYSKSSANNKYVNWTSYVFCRPEAGVNQVLTSSPDAKNAMDLINQYGNGDSKTAFMNYMAATGKQSVGQSILQNWG